MGIVKISDLMHENLRVAGNALSRSINAQAEHWMRIGMLAELHPALDHREICQVLIRAEQAGGFDLATISASLSSLAAPALSTPSAASATSAPSPRTARKAGAPA
ncbi:ParD-like family protein [Variovorax sp. RCC_210]|uniref:ParD-like family protein n=1 Tax=Variovorax sp. RCC_210 TaxID=3239217 RepID=UPI003523130A